ncbi:P-loop containing nucleoside triphosphate hydrolase protein [Byssothecium circinans]|uniref:P-loop containing nucleoside triphosphate hydrolase protein n=1 Tax=Byssothecium circinans TaxID=147558 RepID=A0A6A5TJG3_9PLEO|nr:P-loop containing nucleoside triphosphate hydrolase protein [Byssothecium circinans]
MAASSQFSLPPISELFKDPFKRSTEDDAPTEKAKGSKCAVSFCDARYNAKGSRTYLHAGSTTFLNTPKIQGNEASALVVIKYYDDGGNFEYSETDINSPHIRDALRKVVDSDYPDMNPKSDGFTTRNFTHCLFFHREQLREYGRLLEDGEAARHVNLALEHLYENHSRGLRIFKENVEDNVESDEATPALGFDDLWMAFRPGDLVTRKVREMDTICRVVKTSYGRCSCRGSRYLTVTLRMLDCNGEFFGHRDENYEIGEKKISGYVQLRDLTIRPLKYLQASERGTLLRAARVRGEKFIRLAAGIHHCDYHGLAELTKDEIHECMDEYSSSTAMVKGRVMIDSLRFSQVREENTPDLRQQPRYMISKAEHETISDDEKLLAYHSLMGFSLANKKWGLFRIEYTDEVKYNDNAFEKLILPKIQKNMVRALVSAHEEGSLSFDDIIAGKGQGMTILLHGGPGLGKTLTAESVAEHVKRPLYAITAADFSEKLSVTEKRLTDVFDLTSHWSAVLLIDEADVFLAQRTFADVERNAIVAVFLRALEYYSGVLILTTNRVTTLDTAFKSRIHLGIKYHPLSTAARREIWHTFIDKSVDRDKTQCLDDAFLDELADHKIDGRMIKNAVRMAHALAVDAGENMSQSHLQDAVKAMALFEHDMAQANEEERGERGPDIRRPEEHRKRRRVS